MTPGRRPDKPWAQAPEPLTKGGGSFRRANLVVGFALLIGSPFGVWLFLGNWRDFMNPVGPGALPLAVGEHAVPSGLLTVIVAPVGFSILFVAGLLLVRANWRS